MNTDHILQMTRDEYININTGKPATKAEIKSFKAKVIKNKKDTEKRFQDRSDKNKAFISQHKKALKELLDIDDNQVLIYQDEDDVIYRLTTALFDCFDSEYKFEFLKKVKDEFGEDIYFAVIEGYVMGQHDT
jgi:hypothetical protein